MSTAPIDEELRSLAAKWRSEADSMDDLASDEPDDETIMALQCRERSITLRDCANDLDAMIARRAKP